MRVVFFGTPDMAVPSLAAVAEAHAVAAVVCQPDKPQGRSKKLVPPPVKVWALEHGIEVHQPAKLNDGAFEEWLQAQAPEACAIVAYGRILKQPILDVPTLGWLNVHPSMLPAYRGPSPIQSAVRDGLTETGVTIMRLDIGMDTGDILLQEPLAIDPADTSATLSEKAGVLGAELLVRGLNLLESGEAVFTPQDDSAASMSTMFEKRDGHIHWNTPAESIRDLIRAAIPWPVAHCLFHGDTVRIHGAIVIDETVAEQPGTVVRVEKNAIVVATGSTLLGIEQIQPPGKRVMQVADYLRGHGVAVGDRFEEL